MGVVVVNGAQLVCPFGTNPSALTVVPQTACLGCSNPVATIMDTTIPPFGMCTSITNPQVAAATAAALGVLTPQPCVFTPMGTWSARNPNILIGGKPVLTNEASIICGLGMGKVSIVSPGQTTVIAG